MLDIFAKSYLTATRFTAHTRPHPVTEQYLAKRARTSSTEPRTGFRPRFWI